MKKFLIIISILILLYFVDIKPTPVPDQICFQIKDGYCLGEEYHHPQRCKKWPAICKHLDCPPDHIKDRNNKCRKKLKKLQDS